MPTILEGDHATPAGRFAIVAARFNSEIVDRLLAGALDALKQHGVEDADVDVMHVPGSLELPLAAQRLGESGKHAAVICLGAVIKGDTDHYEYVCESAVNGIMQAGLKTGVPTIFGVLTCRKMGQARARAGGKEGNKGSDAAVAAIEMVILFNQLQQ
jgi:6,7-dimethyl-8-ribityllumazine synthase